MSPRIDLTAPVPATWSLVGLLVTVHAVGAAVLVRAGRADGWWAALVDERSAKGRILLGGRFGPLVEDGAWWRLVTGGLLHVDGLHLAINLVALVTVGRVLEPLIGAARWLGVFCLGSVAATTVSQLSGVARSDGSSGGAYALLGAAIAVGWGWRDLPDVDRRWLVRVLGAFAALNVVWSLLDPRLDAAGHVGGLVVGGLLGRVLDPQRSDTGWWLVVGAFACTCAYGWGVR